MKQKLQRRNFLRNSLIAISGLLFIRNRVKAGSTVNPISGANLHSTNQTLEVINNLHTTHGNFQDKPIPDADLDLIKKASVQAANSSNMQTYSIIVVKDRKKIKEVSTYEGSAMMLFCVDYNRIIDCATLLGYNYYPDNMTNFVTASINTSLAAQTAVIAAQSLGIDTLLTNGIHRGDMQRVWSILDLPEKKCFPLIALVLGYATEEAPFHKGKLEGTGIFYDGKYHKLTSKEIQQLIDSYDKKENHLGLYEDWDKDGHKHYLDWLHSNWLQGQSKPTMETTEVFKFIKRSGFVEPS